MLVVLGALAPLRAQLVDDTDEKKVQRLDQASKSESSGQLDGVHILLERASKLGSIKATTYLSVLYDNGYGVAKDKQKAQEYFEKAILMDKEGGDDKGGALKSRGLLMDGLSSKMEASVYGRTKVFRMLESLVLDLSGQQVLDIDAIKPEHYSGERKDLLGHSLYELGSFYMRGVGVPKNKAKALACAGKSGEFLI